MPGILRLKEAVDSFYEYMHILASHEVNPLFAPPSDMRNMWLEIKNQIHSHHRLSLPDDQDETILGYHSIMHVTPTVMEGFLIEILCIPLIDKSLHMNLYQVYNYLFFTQNLTYNFLMC